MLEVPSWHKVARSHVFCSPSYVCNRQWTDRKENLDVGLGWHVLKGVDGVLWGVQGVKMQDIHWCLQQQEELHANFSGIWSNCPISTFLLSQVQRTTTNTTRSTTMLQCLYSHNIIFQRYSYACHDMVSVQLYTRMRRDTSGDEKEPFEPYN